MGSDSNRTPDRPGGGEQQHSHALLVLPSRTLHREPVHNIASLKTLVVKFSSLYLLPTTLQSWFLSNQINWLTLEVPCTRLDLGKTAFFIDAPSKWNDLQQTLR